MSCLVGWRRVVPLFAVLLAVAGTQSSRAAVVFSGSGLSPENSAPVSAKVEFSIVGDYLTLVLTNTTSGGTKAQGDSLTGVVFNLSTPPALPSLQLTSISLTTGSSIYTSKTTIDNTVNFNGSWTDDLAASAVPDFGAATTGFSGLFVGGSISTGNAGPNYAVIAGTGTDGTGPIRSDFSAGGPQYPFALNSLTFTFSGAAGVDLSRVQQVGFLFGTAGGPIIPGNGNGPDPGPDPNPIPEPSSILVWAGAMAALGLAMHRRRAKAKA